jgi:hypothetical protein
MASRCTIRASSLCGRSHGALLPPRCYLNLAHLQLAHRVHQLTYVRALAQSAPKLEGRPLDASIGPGLKLMEQQFRIANHLLRLISPMDVDAVMDMYIEAGMSPIACKRIGSSSVCALSSIPMT